MEKKTRDYKAIAKENQFIKHAKEVREQCRLHNVDVGVGLDMYVNNHKIVKTPEVIRQYRAFLQYCREDTLAKIVEELGK